MTASSVDLDTLDRQLLRLLQLDDQRSLRDIAAELGVSAPTCLRRLRRLRAAKIIRRQSAVLDAERLGLRVCAFIEVRLVEAGGQAMRRFEQRMKRCVQVRQLSELAGDIDYLLEVRVASAEELSAFTERELTADASVRAYTTRLVLRSFKDEQLVSIP